MKLRRLCFYTCLSFYPQGGCLVGGCLVRWGVCSQVGAWSGAPGLEVPGPGGGCLLLGGGLPGQGGVCSKGGVPGLGGACLGVCFGGAWSWGCLVWCGCLVWGVPGGGLLRGYLVLGAWSKRVPGLEGLVSQHALRQTPLGEATAADGTHPTGMHSC